MRAAALRYRIFFFGLICAEETQFITGSMNFSVIRGMVKNLPLLRRAGNNGRPWVHAIMCDNKYNDICMIIHASTL